MNHAVVGGLNGKTRVILASAVLAGIGFFLYRGVLAELVVSVLQREGSSHGVFVPFIAAFFLWLKWEKVRAAEVGFSPAAGCAGVGVGLLLLLMASFAGETSLAALSFIFIAAGVIAGLLGTAVFKEVSFPLFFLAAMIPLPAFIYEQASEIMRDISTAGSVGVLKVLGVSHYREGYEVVLADVRLQINHSCSGIRYLLSYFVFSLAYAFLFKQGYSARILVVLSSIPISIIGGVARLSVIFLAAEYIGPFMADRQPHIFLSWAVFGAILICAMAVERKLGGGKAGKLGG